MVNRFDVYLVSLDAQTAKNAKNTRPCVVISPDEMNHNIGSVLVAPLTGAGPSYPTRIQTDFLNAPRSIVLDQIMSVDTDRLVKQIGTIDAETRRVTLERLQEMFAE